MRRAFAFLGSRGVCSTSPQHRFLDVQRRFGSNASEFEIREVRVWPETKGKPGRGISILWSDQHVSELPALWLRHCMPSRMDSTGQRLALEASDVSPKIFVKGLNYSGTAVDVEWGGVEENSWHTRNSCFTAEWLRDNCPQLISSCRPPNSANSKPKGENSGLEYAEVVKSSEGVAKLLSGVNEFGYVRVRNVPPTQEGMQDFIAPIMPLMPHLYGLVFDVKAQDAAINVAYTNQGLQMHQDLSYYESPPGLQILHAVRRDACVVGGASTLLDAFAVAEMLWERNPKAFATLVKLPATFLKFHTQRDWPARRYHQRPMISVNSWGEVINVFWSQAFEGPAGGTAKDIEEFYAAYHALQELVESQEAMEKFGIEFMLNEGDLVVFNNRRMLHGRTEIESRGGVRHLRGCYVSIDDYLNNLRVLQLKHPDIIGPVIRTHGCGSFLLNEWRSVEKPVKGESK